MREEALKQLGDAIKQAEDGRTTLEDSIDSLYDLDAQIDGRLYVSGSQSVSRDAIEIQLYPVMEQLRSVIEGLVISYGQLSASRDIYAQQADLYRSVLTMQESMLGLGLATQAEVAQARNDLNVA